MSNDSTITVQNLIDYGRSHIKLAPVVGIGGVENEPALTFANFTKQQIINSKFNWDWNRRTIPPFVTVENQWEYIPSVDEFGWLERAYREDNDSTATPKPINYMEVKRNLQKFDYKGDPQFVAMDMNRFGIPVLRVGPIPAAFEWRLYIDYQKRPTKITALTGCDGVFDPIPDDMELILKQFFIAYCYRLVDRQQHYQEMAIARQLLIDYKENQANEESDTHFVPNSPYLSW